MMAIIMPAVALVPSSICPNFDLPLSCRISVLPGRHIQVLHLVNFNFCHLLPLFGLYTCNGKRTTSLTALYAFPGADCMQGARAQQKRERKAQSASKDAKSQSKSNEKAKSIICSVCKQPFVSLFRTPSL